MDVYLLYELGESLYPKGSRELEERAAIEFVLSSASRCHNCAAILYDEEIMAGWQPEDSNLNTVCQYCDKATVPLLTVTILDYRYKKFKLLSHNYYNMLTICLFFLSRCKTNEKSSDPLMGALVELSDKPREQLDPITIPYLNPLVLRKELESVLSQEGDTCLTRHIFIEEHPIVYWNLIWYFERINLTSHLSDLWLHNDANKQLQSNSNSVSIRTMWDNERIHMGRLPMYLQWKLNTTEDRT